jgi:hypothetical protein
LQADLPADSEEADGEEADDTEADDIEADEDEADGEEADEHAGYGYGFQHRGGSFPKLIPIIGE